MKLVPNWQRILLRSYSMQWTVAGAALLLFAEMWFLTAGYQIISPYVLGYAGLVVPALTVFGRVVDQGIERGEEGSHGRMWRLVAGYAVYWLTSVFILASVLVFPSIGCCDTNIANRLT